MGLFTVSLNEQDRQLIRQLIALLVDFSSTIKNKEVVAKVSLEDKLKVTQDDIRK